MKFKLTHSLIDVLTASPTEPYEPVRLQRIFASALSSMRSLERDAKPTYADWKHVWSVYTMFRAFVDDKVVEDPDELLRDARDALLLAGAAHIQRGMPLRLDAQGIHALRSMIEDFMKVCTVVPQRTLLRAHRAAEMAQQRMVQTQNKDLMIAAVNTGAKQ